MQGDWQPIETAPTDVLVQLGGWDVKHDYMSPTGRPLEWREGPSFAFIMNEKAIRVRFCQKWVRWWKPLDLAPPAVAQAGAISGGV